MASPITHIALSEKVFDKFFQDKKKKDFFVGTVFSDIRYLGVADRRKTHFPFKQINLKDVQKEQNSFSAGLKFHSLVDEAREGYIKLSHAYSLCPDSKYRTLALKILEDELCYNKVVDWSEFINFLNEILSEEQSFNIDKTDIERWHKILQDFFSQKPNKTTTEKFGIDLGFTKNDLDKINNFLDEARPNDKLKQVVEGFYNNFESLLI